MQVCRLQTEPKCRPRSNDVDDVNSRLSIKTNLRKKRPNIFLRGYHAIKDLYPIFGQMTATRNV